MLVRRVAIAVAIAGVALLALPGSTLAQEAPPTTAPTEPPAAAGVPSPAASGRRWLVPIPAGCDAPALPDVVFVGTLVETGTPAAAPQETAYETARFRLDQARAGEVGRFTYDGFIDVRYGLDTKDLTKGDQYLVGASVDATAGVLMSTIRLPEPYFGGDDVIAASERDVTCPAITDPIRTTHVDGSPVDASVVGPFLDSKSKLLRAFVLPFAVAFGIIFGLAALRWLVTGVGKGVGSFVRTASEPREVRGAMRSRPGVSRDLEDAGRR